MSGGDYDYAYLKVLDFQGQFPSEARPDMEKSTASPELRERFRQHLRLVAEAMRAIEWNDSGDGDDDETKLIEACLSGARKLEFVKLSELNIVGWYEDEQPYLSSWYGETTKLEVTGVTLSECEGLTFTNPKEIKHLDDRVKLKTVSKDTSYEGKIIVICFGKFV